MSRTWNATLMALALAVTSVANASETQWWTLESAADHAKSESRGVVVRADGVLEAGPAIRSWSADSLKTIWAMVRLADGSVALAGDRGRVDRWIPGQGVRPWARLGRGQVLSLAADGNGVLAGTGPTGLVYRIGAKGDTTLLARTGERYVWGIVPAGAGRWWIATGTRGRLGRITGGKYELVFDSDESNLTALVSDGAGGAVAGGDSRGRVYAVSASGAARTWFDANEDEIRALSRDANGVVWAAALSGSATSPADADDEATPAPQRGPVSGARAVIYRLNPDSASALWWTSPQPFVFALAGTNAGLMMATGNRAGVFRLERSNGAAQWLAAKEGQVTALLPLPQGGVLAGTSNPASVIELGPGRAERGTLTSDVLDARRHSRFGRVRWNGTGSPRFETRTGNAEEPDTTWSTWEACGTEGRVTSPPGRFLQWRATLAGESRVDEVAVSWREQNLAPRLEDLTVAPQAQGVREGELGPRSEAVTQSLAGGQKVEYSISTSSQKPLRELPLWARGLRTLQWRALDPNNDPLRFRVEVKRDPDGPWIEVGKDLEAALFTWNTVTLPDGRYRVRVTATDALGNAVGEETSTSLTSEVFRVDNTAPEVTALSVRAAAGGLRVEGSARDAASPLWRLEVSVDDGPWRSIAPSDGLVDREETSFAFDWKWQPLAPGEHLVSVRAVDLAGNSATRAVPVSVGTGR